jgi:hypothetical protein
MEVVGALGAALGIGGGSAAAAAGTAASVGSIAATVGSVIGIGSSIVGMIAQGAMTAYQAAAAMRQGQAAAHEARIEEINASLQASRDKVAAEDEALRINRALAETIGDQAVAYAAAGISLGSGTPVEARREARRRANEDLSISRSNQASRTAAWGQRVWAARARAANAMASARDQAVGAWGDFAIDTLNRGLPQLATAIGGARGRSRGGVDPWDGLR